MIVSSDNEWCLFGVRLVFKLNLMLVILYWLNDVLVDLGVVVVEFENWMFLLLFFILLLVW